MKIFTLTHLTTHHHKSCVFCVFVCFFSSCLVFIYFFSVLVREERRNEMKGRGRERERERERGKKKMAINGMERFYRLRTSTTQPRFPLSFSSSSSLSFLHFLFLLFVFFSLPIPFVLFYSHLIMFAIFKI